MTRERRRIALEIATKAESLIDLADEADLPMVARLLGGAWRQAIRVAAAGEEPIEQLVEFTPCADRTN